MFFSNARILGAVGIDDQQFRIDLDMLNNLSERGFSFASITKHIDRRTDGIFSEGLVVHTTWSMHSKNGTQSGKGYDGGCGGFGGYSTKFYVLGIDEIPRVIVSNTTGNCKRHSKCFF